MRKYEPFSLFKINSLSFHWHEFINACLWSQQFPLETSFNNHAFVIVSCTVFWMEQNAWQWGNNCFFVIKAMFIQNHRTNSSTQGCKIQLLWQRFYSQTILSFFVVHGDVLWGRHYREKLPRYFSIISQNRLKDYWLKFLNRVHNQQFSICKVLNMKKVMSLDPNVAMVNGLYCNRDLKTRQLCSGYGTDVRTRSKS